MKFFPIVERELRIAAGKWTSFWLRVAAAVLTGLIGMAFLLFTMLGFVAPSSVGQGLFTMLTWLAFITACLAGVFFTSDCISEEKREGTLGLLFLTDLRGSDVVLGKLVSNSLRASFGLMAAFPIIALALIMGGVTGAQFTRTMVALVVTIGFSLTLGIAMSSVTRDGRRSLSGTLLGLLVFCAGAPVGDLAWSSATSPGSFTARLSLASPGYLFVAAGAGGSSYWIALAVCATLALLLLGFACWATPLGWQDANREGAVNTKSWFYHLRYGSPATRARRRVKLLAINPVLWFCTRLRWRGFLMSGFLIAAIVAVAVLIAQGKAQEGAITALVAGALLSWGLYLWMASEAARFFVESRRSGALELLLATPLSGRDIVIGLRGALRRLFVPPISLLVVLFASAGFAAVVAMLSKSSKDAESMVMAISGFPLFGASTGTISVVSRVADLITIGWVAIWMGLTSRNANLAVLKTLLFVQVLPGVVMMLLTPFIMMPMAILGAGMAGAGSSSSPSMWLMFLIPSLVSEGIWLGKDLIFFLWARSRLETDLRILALPESARVWQLPPPLIAPAPSAP